MIKNRHFRFFCCCCCLFVCLLYFIDKKQYFEAFFSFITLLFVLSGALAAFVWKGSPFFPGSSNVCKRGAATPVYWIICSMRYPILLRVHSKQSNTCPFSLALPQSRGCKRQKKWVSEVYDLYKPCAAFDDRALLIVLVSLYFLFFHFESRDNTKEICFFKITYYSRAKIWCVICVKRMNFPKTFIGKTKQTC